MSLQIKKPLSAQAVGTDMYKNGGVSQKKPATKQPEWSTKSLEQQGETEKKKKQNKKLKPNVQNVQSDTMRFLKGVMISFRPLTSSALRLVQDG